MADRRTVWKASSFARAFPRSHSGIIEQQPAGGWAWRLEDLNRNFAEDVVAMGEATSARLAKVACNRAAAKHGLLNRGAGLKAVRRG